MSKNIIIDSNLLLLWVVGQASPRYIGTRKNLSAYSISDFDLLTDIIGCFSSILLTPNTLSETSNLLDRTKNASERRSILQVFRSVVGSNTELYVRSAEVCERKEFAALGLTDTTLLSLCSKETTLVTSDLDLYLAAARNAFDVINFNHHREANT